MNKKKFEIITVLRNLLVVVAFSVLFISNPIDSTTGTLLIFITLSMANLFFIITKSDYKKDWFSFWRKGK